MQAMPRVSVITAAYNAAPHIGETIESVLAQTFTDFEYIVVDDGSCDDTAAIAAGFGSRVSLVRQQNAGAGAARNRGVELTGGEYVAIIDADDVWEPGKLERQVVEMDRDPDAGLCYTNGFSIRANGSVLQPLLAPARSRLTCLTALTGHSPIVTSSVLYRRRFLEARPYGKLRYGEDYHVNLKVLWRCGERSVFIDEPLVRYRVVDTSLTRQTAAWETGRQYLKAVEAFIDDMRIEKPVPQDIQRKGLAYAHFQWAWFCIHAGVQYGFATRELAYALVCDWQLGPLVARQVAKMGLTRMGLR